MALIGLLRVQDNEPAITLRQTWLLIAMGSALFLTGCGQSLLPLLYPTMAMSKKQRTWQMSASFAAFQLGRILVGQAERKVMALATPKFLVVTGLFFSGGTTILFGCMQWSTVGTTFVVLTTLLQLINGIGVAMVFYAVALLVGGGAFYSNSIYFLALLDSFGLAGLIAGAPLGSIIYSLSNYFTAFAILGLILLLIAIACMAVVEDDAEELIDWPSSDDVTSFLHSPLVWIALIAIFVNSMLDSYVVITLSIELQKHKFGAVATGGMFLMTYLCACVADFSSGAIVQRSRCNFFLISIGSILLAVGLVFLGPAAFVKFQSQMGTIALGLVMKGLATGIISSCAIASLVRSARLQFPDDLTTFILVIKMTFSAEYFGHLVGSLSTGPLYDLVGHALTTSFFALMFAGMVVLFLMAHCYDKRRQRYSLIESTPMCGCTLNHREPHADQSRPSGYSSMGLSSSIEPDSGEWNWLYGRNKTVL